MPSELPRCLFQKAGGRNAKKKFLLKTNLDPFKQCAISGRFASGNEETKCFLHFMLEPCGWENVDLLETICHSFPLAKNLITQSEPQRTGNDIKFPDFCFLYSQIVFLPQISVEQIFLFLGLDVDCSWKSFARNIWFLVYAAFLPMLVPLLGHLASLNPT